ncbi:MAG: PfkB family carbohydrate kinase [Opitutus sp.]
MPSSTVTIACFGEALWDVLPRGIFLGGAPLNTAYHLSRQGIRAVPVTAVGRDTLGDEIIRRLSDWKIDRRAVARLSGVATGTGRASLDARGNASYRFAPDVAWDRIPVGALLRSPPPRALVFGSLALRSPRNRRALAQLLSAWRGALRVLDLNLRAPFDHGAPVAFALRHADIVKLNDLELARMSGGRIAWSSGAIERRARAFAGRHRLARVCVSAGHRGAGLLWDGAWHWEPARKVRVRDTIGAGDAFLAGLLAALLGRGSRPEVALANACRFGEFVAGFDGATPPYRCDARGLPGPIRT